MRKRVRAGGGLQRGVLRPGVPAGKDELRRGVRLDGQRPEQLRKLRDRMPFGAQRGAALPLGRMHDAVSAGLERHGWERVLRDQLRPSPRRRDLQRA